MRELGELRTPVSPDSPELFGPVARRMLAAVLPLSDAQMVTPMAAVAGAVADEIGAAIGAAGSLDRWMVNNGGDIAFGLADGHHYVTGLVVDPRRAAISSTVRLEAGSGVGGIATSGRHGRSLSLGIADAVTVLAPTAAAADAAATLIANHVDVGSVPPDTGSVPQHHTDTGSVPQHHTDTGSVPRHDTDTGSVPQVVRQPASSLDPDSDLGDTLVTVDVGPLTVAQIQEALNSGLSYAESCVSRGLISAAVLHLAGHSVATATELIAR